MMPSGRTRAVTQLETLWRQRLEFAALRYADAKHALIRATEEAGSIHSKDVSMEKATAAERTAMEQYSKVLAVFTRLVIDGKIPALEDSGEFTDPRRTA